MPLPNTHAWPSLRSSGRPIMVSTMTYRVRCSRALYLVRVSCVLKISIHSQLTKVLTLPGSAGYQLAQIPLLPFVNTAGRTSALANTVLQCLLEPRGGVSIKPSP